MVEVKRQKLINANGKPRMYISKRWLERLGIDINGDREVKVSFDGERIIIEKIK